MIQKQRTYIVFKIRKNMENQSLNHLLMPFVFLEPIFLHTTYFSFFVLSCKGAYLALMSWMQKYWNFDLVGGQWKCSKILDESFFLSDCKKIIIFLKMRLYIKIFGSDCFLFFIKTLTLKHVDSVLSSSKKYIWFDFKMFFFIKSFLSRYFYSFTLIL